MKQTFRHQNQEISYVVHRTHRKNSVALLVKPDAQVVLRLPQSLPLAQIQDLLQKWGPWILEKQKYFKILEMKHPPKEFVSGESFSYLGNNLRLKVCRVRGEREGCVQEGKRLIIKLGENESSAQIESLILNWYHQQAFQYLRGRVKNYQCRLGIFSKKILIKDQRTKWGSCSRRGILSFNWRLIMMPRPIIDYIVVHELCHLTHKSHNNKFWSQVETILPNFEERRNWLKQHSYEILNCL